MVSGLTLRLATLLSHTQALRVDMRALPFNRDHPL